MKYDFIIIGGGLSGLYTAAYLEKTGHSYLLLEARSRLGGRIISSSSLAAHSQSDQFDLGPSWFWPNMNHRVMRLVDNLSLPILEQYETGDMLIEQSGQAGIRQVSNQFFSSPQSMRVSGGMAQLVAGVTKLLNPENIKYEHQVHAVSHNEAQGYSVDVIHQAEQLTLESENIIFALPHRLIANNIRFTPALPETALNALDKTPTWMAAHAKFFAIYDRPFWRENGLSGYANSQVGPLVEIHDASAENGHAALFGFIGYDAQTRAKLGATELKTMAVEQLARLFGPEAYNVTEVKLLDWSKEAYTAVEKDHTMPTHHPRYGLNASLTHLSQQGMYFAGTESAKEFGGFIEGALEAAESVIEQLAAR
ncbi:flavin monoamine oxidase family protein [Vibrio campbellii]|uniref:flavin monoamine oxidase family protein n=1 Tax=Vibrio campbellii TaxID=680 RepID=UPI0002AE5E76|nr:FAD-dependent oxidoreductase [Vibrio campbellii]ARV75300.1 oxidoreductase [Vibrio campbellii CAIM 519 = NBRC 15631 = ATCC 25920]ELU52354.1 oxidoreductase [Vibrio campbellii CAIM 519 = NBRC 15631 = ATCC 25920]HDM8042841.1 FAD-dependent oxidoreductase [Vibrio campbellii]HDM8046879.1 FAD-dependent oxidoreductase [Vibrio campbellii]